MVGETSWEQTLLKYGVQQRLFDDIEGEREPGAPKELPYYDKPRTDNQKLINWQKEYRDGDDKALDLIFELSKQIAWKYINKISKKNLKVKRLSASERENKATDAATYIVVQLIKRPDFAMTTPSAYVWLRVMHELFYHRKVDKIVDFVDLARFFKEGSEPEAEEENLEDKIEAMKKYVAYGEGRTLTFNSQTEVKEYFYIASNEKWLDVIEDGKPVEDPKTGELFYIDELVTRRTEC